MPLAYGLAEKNFAKIVVDLIRFNSFQVFSRDSTYSKQIAGVAVETVLTKGTNGI
jgi:hypothetical protein